MVAATTGLSVGFLAGAGQIGSEYVQRYDTNGDNVLSVEELPIAQLFSDTNGDDVMDAAETEKLAQRIRARLGAFKWVNPLPDDHGLEGVKYGTFVSQSMSKPVGYCIYLPPGYAEDSDARYPVVYFLHGGRPGNETAGVELSKYVHAAVTSGEIAPLIYVFVNGGPVSHYNYGEKDSLAVDVFIKELIPHIDSTYRTIAHRGGRALQGFSQGGRGTTRIMFQYPELFVSAAPGGSAYDMEKQIAENGGVEKEERIPGVPVLQFAPDENAFDRARQYAQADEPPLQILIWVGTKGFNYESTLEYMGFLFGLGIPFERLVGLELMRFHEAAFIGATRE
jgi:endo-1,4-beta-xylanase